jgi:hypothetical protein
LLTITMTACSSGTKTATAASGSTVTSSAAQTTTASSTPPTGAGSSASTPTTATGSQIGFPIRYTVNDATAQIVVNRVTPDAKPQSQLGASKNGQFILVNMTISVVDPGSQGVDENSEGMTLQLDDGTVVGSDLGLGFDSTLPAHYLTAGQKATGDVVFDVAPSAKAAVLQVLSGELEEDRTSIRLS